MSWRWKRGRTQAEKRASSIRDDAAATFWMSLVTFDVAVFAFFSDSNISFDNIRRMGANLGILFETSYAIAAAEQHLS